MTLRRKKKTSLKERIRNQPSFALFYYVPEILILCLKGKIYLSQIKIMSAILFDLKQQVFIESRTVKRQTDDRERPRGGCEVISSSPLQPHGGTTQITDAHSHTHLMKEHTGCLAQTQTGNSEHLFLFRPQRSPSPHLLSYVLKTKGDLI